VPSKQKPNNYSSSIWSDSTTASGLFQSTWENGNQDNNSTSQIPPQQKQQPKGPVSTIGTGRSGDSWSSNTFAPLEPSDDFSDKGNDANMNMEKLLPVLTDDGDDAPPGFTSSVAPTSSVTPVPAGGRAVYPPPPSSSGAVHSETLINAPFYPPNSWGFSRTQRQGAGSYDPFSAYQTQPQPQQQSQNPQPNYSNFPYNNGSVPTAFVHKDG